MEGIAKYADIFYITDENCEFYRTKGGFLGVKTGGVDLGQAGAYRMFPITHGDIYISIRDKDLKEIGVIKELGALSAASRALVDEELARRYFVPEITQVKNVKEEFAYTYWDTETTAGPKNFIVFDMGNSLVPLVGNSVMLIDVDGNRYKISDINTLAEKHLKFIEVWL